MENRCPKCGEEHEYTFENDVSQDGDILWVDYWRSCCSCGQHWKYTERFTLDTAWINTEEED